jgi:hypothetical protein
MQPAWKMVSWGKLCSAYTSPSSCLASTWTHLQELPDAHLVQPAALVLLGWIHFNTAAIIILIFHVVLCPKYVPFQHYIYVIHIYCMCHRPVYIHHSLNC